MRAILVCIALAGCGGASSAPVAAPVDVARPAAQKTYAIHFYRPSHAGERTHVVMDQTENKGSKITQDATVVEDKHEQHALHYDAVHTAVEVDGKGQVTRSRYDVKELVSDGHPLVRGVVEITRTQKETDAIITVDGTPASKEVREALASLLKLGLSGANDDQVFGTKTPQPVGAHWPIDARLAQADLRDDSGIDATSVNGDVWLEGTTRVGDLDCLDVRAKMGLDGIAVPGMPEGSETEFGRADAEMQATLPVAGTPERASDHMSMKIAFRVRVPSPTGRAVNVSLAITQTRDSHFSPM
jgi:hypothetical protein